MAEGYVPRTFNVRPDQAMGIANICAAFQSRTGKYLSASRVAREALDSGLPMVRQRYDELARKAQEGA